jgi:hypothetical protein
MNIHSSSLGKAIKTVRKYTKYGRKSFSGDYFAALVIFPCKSTMAFAGGHEMNSKTLKADCFHMFCF